MFLLLFKLKDSLLNDLSVSVVHHMRICFAFRHLVTYRDKTHA